MKPVFVIAEAGSCHDGSLDKAKTLVAVAAESGASACKFQFWSSAAKLALRRRSGAHYEAIYRQYQMPAEWLPVLKADCDAAGLAFMVTIYLPEDIAVVAPHVAHFKIASFEAADEEFIRAHFPYCAGTDRQIIVSTGLQSNATLQSLKILRHNAELMGQKGSVQIRLLHCISAYPAPADSLALRQIKHEELDGFSDHAAAGWIASGAVAVACGAKILEVHLRLQETDEQNPDAGHALMPDQLRAYINHVRVAEKAIGEDPWRRHNPAEDAMRKFRVSMP